MSIRVTIPGTRSVRLTPAWPSKCIGCGKEEDLSTHNVELRESVKEGDYVLSATSDARLHICSDCIKKAEDGVARMKAEPSRNPVLFPLLVLVVPTIIMAISLVIGRSFSSSIAGLSMFILFVPLIVPMLVTQLLLNSFLGQSSVSNMVEAMAQEPHRYYARLDPRGFFSFRSPEFYKSYRDLNPDDNVSLLHSEDFEKEAISASRAKGTSRAYTCGCCPSCLWTLALFFILTTVLP